MIKFIVTQEDGKEITISCESFTINGGILEFTDGTNIVAAFSAWESVRQSKDE